MDEHSESIVMEHDAHSLSLGKYIAGFVLSIGVTLLAYWLATHQSVSKSQAVAGLTVLALTQFVVQMLLFLHAGDERRPRWKLGVLFLMLSLVLILVLGSLWIMHNLNYRMMASPQQTEQYLKSQDSL